MELKITRREDNRAFITVSSVAFGLLIALVLSTPFVEMSGAVSQGHKSYRLYGYGLLGLLQIVLVMMRGWQKSLRIVNTPVGWFLVWCALSLAWTQHLDLTGKRFVLLGLLYCGTFAGVYDLGTARSLAILRILLIAALVVNFVAVIAVPHIGTHILGNVRLWRGVMAHKNIAGMLCAFTIISFAFDANRTTIAGRAAVIAAALIFFYFAWSKTAWISLPVALASGAAAALVGARYASSLQTTGKSIVSVSRGLFGLLLLGLILATLQRDFFVSLTDNTSALTTRAAIWRPMIQFYLDHPLLGAGYGAYWDASANLIDNHARDAGIWKDIDQGHNGYLDLLVQVGLPGIALALYAAFVWPMRDLCSMIGKNPQRAALIIALSVFCVIENFSESSLFADDALGNVFLIFALACVHRFKVRSSKGDTASKSSDEAHLDSLARFRESRQKRHQIVS